MNQSLIRFIAVMHADTDGIVPGNALVVSVESGSSTILNSESQPTLGGPQETVQASEQVWKCLLEQVDHRFLSSVVPEHPLLAILWISNF